MSSSSVGEFVFSEPEETKVFEMDNLVAAPTNADELNMGIQRDSDAKDTSVPLSSANPPILSAAPKPLSSNMD